MHDSPDFFASCARFAGFGHFSCEMKRILKTLFLLCVFGVAAGCSVARDYHADPSLPNSDYALNSAFRTGEPLSLLITVKQAEDGSAYLYYNDQYRFRYSEPFVRQFRAMSVMQITSLADEQGYCGCNLIYLEALDEGDMTYDASVPGSDGLDIKDVWVTSVSDGYLTIQYDTWWGEHPVKHDFHLVAGLDPDNPYSLELRHDAHSDPHSVQSEGIVCFDINDLPDTQGENRLITLNYRKISGDSAKMTFVFKTRQ